MRPQDIFDPEVPELPALLPKLSFPGPAFRHPDILAALRPLGLKNTLDWAALVTAAVSVESHRGVVVGEGEEGGNNGHAKQAARVRGRALLTYMDTHEARLFDLKKESTGLLRRVAKLMYSNPAAEQRGRERQAALQKIMTLSWVRGVFTRLLLEQLFFIGVCNIALCLRARARLCMWCVCVCVFF